MSNYRQKFENYKNAYVRLTEGVAKFDKTNDLLRDGLIQRFEFTFELAWKTLKDYSESEGFIVASPREVMFQLCLYFVLLNNAACVKIYNCIIIDN